MAKYKKTPVINLMASVALVGVFPPPYGGVSVSLERSISYFDKMQLDYIVYNTGPSSTNHPKIMDVGWSPWAMAQLLFRSKHQIVHFNTSRWWVRLFAAMINMTTGAKVIIGARGYSLPNSYFHSGFLKRRIVKWTLRHFERVIATNSELCLRIIQMGMEPRRVDVIPAFIPPPGPLSIESIPSSVQEFCRGKSPILAANGGYVLIEGKDAYGLEALVKLTEDLLPSYPNIVIVIYIRKGAESDKEYFRATLAKAHSQGLKDHILFYESSGEFYHFFSICDVFLRPTTTDGDANSIREALYFGVPVVASNVVPRPEGCNLYSEGNYSDLLEKTKLIMNNLPAAKQRIANVPQYNAAVRIAKVYRELLA